MRISPKKDVPGTVKIGGGGKTCSIQYCNKGYVLDKTSCRCVLEDVCKVQPCTSSTYPLCVVNANGTSRTCACQGNSCGAGKTCVGGECVNCKQGVNCNCPSGQVSNGSGSCYTPKNSCNPNPCPATAPTCSSLSETDYSCSCTSTSCGGGKSCNGTSCDICKAGDTSTACGCGSSGKEADGNGGCRCPGIKVSDGSGGCKCPSDYESDGKGGCKLKDKCAGVECAKGKKCDQDTGSCVNCPLGEDCGCQEDDAYASGEGTCTPNNNCSDNADCADNEWCNGGMCEAVTCDCNDSAYFNCVISNHAGSCKCKSSTCQHDAYCWQKGQKCVYCGAAGTGVDEQTGQCIMMSGHCTTQEDCNVGEECLSGTCKPCGNSQGSLCAAYCKQGSNSQCTSSPSSCSCQDSCLVCTGTNCTCSSCKDGYYLENGRCYQKGNCSVSTPLHWRTMTCTKCDSITGKCQGSSLKYYGSKGADVACSVSDECQTGWCLAGGTAGRSGNRNVQGSHCS